MAISDTFGAAITKWTAMRGTWEANAGVLRMTAGDAGDHDAGIIYDDEATTTIDQWIEVKLSDWLVDGGNRLGPIFRIQEVSSVADALWLNIDVTTEPMWNYLSTIVNGVFGADITAGCIEHTFSKGDYLGIRVMGNDAAVLLEYYDNGTASKAYGTWGTPYFSYVYNNPGTPGNYTGLWYGCISPWTYPAGYFDDYKAGDVTGTKYVNTTVLNTQAGDPITISHTPGSAATAAIVSIVVGGTTGRTGGAPTIDGTDATQIDSVRTGLEANIEAWYVCKAFDGTAFDVVIQNDNAVTCHIEVITINAGTGYTSELADSDGNANADDTGDGLNLTLTTTATGDFVWARIASGEDAVASVTSNYGANFKSSDHGTYVSKSVVAIAESVGAQTVGWTWTNDDSAMVGAVFTAVGAGASIGGALNVHVRKAL